MALVTDSDCPYMTWSFFSFSLIFLLFHVCRKIVSSIRYCDRQKESLSFRIGAVPPQLRVPCACAFSEPVLGPLKIATSTPLSQSSTKEFEVYRNFALFWSLGFHFLHKSGSIVKCDLHKPMQRGELKYRQNAFTTLLRPFQSAKRQNMDCPC